MQMQFTKSVLVLGSGGREHAIAWKLSQSSLLCPSSTIYVAPGNGATALPVPPSSTQAPSIPIVNVPISLSPNNFPSLVSFAADHHVGLVVVGPEDPLAGGIADMFSDHRIACFGPSRLAAQLESSKAYSKAFMKRHNIPTADYQTFTSLTDALAYLSTLPADTRIVVKASGLAAGKGVLMCHNRSEAEAACTALLGEEARFGAAGKEVVIEEWLNGVEASILAFCDGRTVRVLPAAQDHKRIYEFDQGLNTGGMGAFAPAHTITPQLTQQIIDTILQPCCDGCVRDGHPFVGVLFAGLMLTSNGPYCLEFNVRFGDPETQVVLPLLLSDLLVVMLACIEGRLDNIQLEWKPDTYAACVCAVSEGYPEAYKKGKVITGLDSVHYTEANPAMIFQAGTEYNREEKCIVTNGGRVLAVTALGNTLSSAMNTAYKNLEQIHFDGMFYRKDLGATWHRPGAHTHQPLRLGVLGSTKGTDLIPILNAIQEGRLYATVEVVISNVSTALILEKAKAANIPAILVVSKKKTREEFDREVLQIFHTYRVDVVCLIGFMRIISSLLISAYYNRILNVHPSLLPEFGGGMDLDVHAAVIAAGKQESGCTIHLIHHGPVDGGPILIQKLCRVDKTDTPDGLKAKVQKLEGEAFIEALQLYSDDQYLLTSLAQGHVCERKGLVVLYRTPALSPAQQRQYMERLNTALHAHTETAHINITHIDSEFAYYVDLHPGITWTSLGAEKRDTLLWLLRQTFEPECISRSSFLIASAAHTPHTPSSSLSSPQHSTIIEVGPRLSFTSAWSTNACSICEYSGIAVQRLERFRRYALHSSGSLPATTLSILSDLLYDRMTEQVLTSPLTSFTTLQSPEPWVTVPLSTQGLSALQHINTELGLALDEWDQQWLLHLFTQQLKRDPTNVELFDISQSNSEHSRHWFFRGELYIDGQQQTHSLMDIVKQTLEAHPANSLIAFADNSSAIQGFHIQVIQPSSAITASSFVLEKKHRHLLLTAETHNFPSGVAPFPGAETGTGGRLRDTAATGSGSLVSAGISSYCVGQLHLPNYPLPWEHNEWRYPSNLASPLKIAIEASNGASDYGNKFGEPVLAGFSRSFGMRLPNGERREWIKPIMFSAGIGFIDQPHLRKGAATKGMLVVKIGGPAYRIGMGGSAASSMVQGENKEALDYNAVQRGDAEMEQKVNRVIRACVDLGSNNPIISIHDQGAGGNCFPEADTRVLTDSGLLFLSEIESLIAERQKVGSQVLYACYDTRNKSLVYRPGRLFFPQRQPTMLVSFNSCGETQRWEEESGPYGVLQKGEEDDEVHVGLRVTPDHRMYVQHGDYHDHDVMKPLVYASASSLLSECCCPPSVLCKHRRDGVRMMSLAENGYVMDSDHTRKQRIWEEVVVSLPVVKALGLKNTQQWAAFLQLFGYWISHGVLSYHVNGRGGTNAVRFGRVKSAHRAWLLERVVKAGLSKNGCKFHLIHKGTRKEVALFSITDKRWFGWFNSQYGQKHFSHSSSCETQLSIKKSKIDPWLPSWMLMQLMAAELKLIVEGVHRAVGGSTGDQKMVYTSSSRFCNQLVQLMLHCGYSPHACFTANTIWRIEYSAPTSSNCPESCWPWLQRQAGVSRELYNPESDGRIWCVDVDHPDHLIFAQRAEKHHGVVTKQSRPIITHNCNVLKEIVDPAGGKIDIRAVKVGDETMSVLEIWGAEYQENWALLLQPSSKALFDAICEREKAPVSYVGEVTGDGVVIVYDSQDHSVPVELDLQTVLGNIPKKKFKLEHITQPTVPLSLPVNLSLSSALDRVLRLLSVGSKRYLTNKVDRSVTGLVAQQQCVGPLQLPLADVAVVALSYFDKTGIASAVGEQPIKGLLSPANMARLTVGEALTNIVWAQLTSITDIKCSGNWMWAAKLPGEGAALHDAAIAMRDVMIALGLSVDGGKDSLSMAARAPDGETVKAPGELVVTLYAPCTDITKTITPDLKAPGRSTLLHINLSGLTTQQPPRLGGSALATVFDQLGSSCPNLEDPVSFRRGWETIQQLILKGWICSGHDISDGGLVVCVLEMAFAGNCGMQLQMQGQGSLMEHMFGEELGAVVEVLNEQLPAVQSLLSAQAIAFAIIGTTTLDPAIQIAFNGVNVLSSTTPVLRDVWEATSFELEKLQANPECVASEQRTLSSRTIPPYCLTFTMKDTSPSVLEAKPGSKPKVAIIREEGCNGDREMAAAFYAAGFDCWDVTMTDLLQGRIHLNCGSSEDGRPFRGVAFVGGFSYADVMDSAKGWAGAIKKNQALYTQFTHFYQRSDTFSLGVCNGCQLMALLGWVPFDATSREYDGDNPPARFIHNPSGRYESRWSTVRIEKSASLFLQGMEGSVLGCWVSHGEGRAHFPAGEKTLTQVQQQHLAPLRFVDDAGNPTEVYPFNPNGSPGGIAALTSADGRHLALMPHPERCHRSWSCPYLPSPLHPLSISWTHQFSPTPTNASPWLRLFQNARAWCDAQPLNLLYGANIERALYETQIQKQMAFLCSESQLAIGRKKVGKVRDTYVLKLSELQHLQQAMMKQHSSPSHGHSHTAHSPHSQTKQHSPASGFTQSSPSSPRANGSSNASISGSSSSSSSTSGVSPSTVSATPFLDDDVMVLITTDRISAFDRMLACIPCKGHILNHVSAFWFSQTAHIIPNHVLSVPHPNVTIAKHCTPFAIEFVCRGYLTGSTSTSLWTHYAKGSRNYCGHILADGMKKNQKLPENLITPTTKSDEHDRPISASEIVAEGWMTLTDWEYTAAKALALFVYGQHLALEHGLILVDTKYEFGKTIHGEIILIDEIHTPDSSRYWIANSYEQRHAQGLEPEMIDKEFIRLWYTQHCDPYKDAVLPTPPQHLIVELSRRYILLYEMITGGKFEFPQQNSMQVANPEAISISVMRALQQLRDQQMLNR